MKNFIISALLILALTAIGSGQEFGVAFRGNAFKGALNPGLSLSPGYKINSYFTITSRLSVQPERETLRISQWSLAGGLEENFNPKNKVVVFAVQAPGVLLTRRRAFDYQRDFVSYFGGGVKFPAGFASKFKLEAGNEVTRIDGRWNQRFYWEVGFVFHF